MAWAIVFGAHASAEGTTFEGDWLAPAEDANDVDAVIHLAPQASEWSGVIKAIIVTRPDQAYKNESVCTACEGAKRGHTFKGLEIAWGLTKGRDDKLSGGHILDPGDGQVYECEMMLSHDGKTMKVLAYKGFKFIGHTMIWQRE